MTKFSPASINTKSVNLSHTKKKTIQNQSQDLVSFSLHRASKSRNNITGQIKVIFRFRNRNVLTRNRVTYYVRVLEKGSGQAEQAITGIDNDAESLWEAKAKSGAEFVEDGEVVVKVKPMEGFGNEWRIGTEEKLRGV